MQEANNVKIIDIQVDLKDVLVDWLGSTASGFTKKMWKRFRASLIEHVMDVRDKLSIQFTIQLCNVTSSKM